MVKVTFEGKTLSKNTKRKDVSHVVVALHKGEYKIVGLHKSYEHAQKELLAPCNPAYTNLTVAEVCKDGIESGLTGEDWEPTASTRYYAQKGELYAFGRTEKEAITALLKKL